MIVDVEHHLQTKESWVKSGGKPGQTVILRTPDGTILRPLDDASWDVEIHLKNMDAAGIDMTVLSSPSVMPVEDAKSFHEYFASIVKKYPKRFAAMASVLPLGGKASFDELERAIKGLGLKGVLICATIEGKPLDSRELWPFYKKVSELKVPLFIHPSELPPGFEALNGPYDLSRTMGREFDLILATFRLCAGGALEEFPDLKIAVAHFGGGYSSIKERMDRYIRVMGAKFWNGKPLISEPYFENYQKYFDRLYFNLAGREVGIQTIKCALTNIRPERLMFATDYPPNFVNDAKGMKTYIEKIKKLDMDKKTIEGILGGNAVELFNLK
jgi:predicted TIM-barrel fold metal-dependent hydrolase